MVNMDNEMDKASSFPDNICNEIKDNQERNEALITILVFLLKHDISDELYRIIGAFYSIYKDDEFRHSYSKLTSFLNDQEKKYSADALDFFSLNLNIVYNEIIKQDFNNNGELGFDTTEENIKYFRKKFLKLKDHIDLEIMRIKANENVRYFREQLDQYNIEREKLSKELHNQVKNINEDLKKNESQLRNFNAQSITVLSIFAGVVMAFTGGFSLLGSALNNINETGLFKLTFVILLIGFILFNTLFMLLYTISSITNNNISTTCLKTKNRECKIDEPCKDCSWLNRIFRKYSYILYVNVFLIGSMLFMIVARYCKWFG